MANWIRKLTSSDGRVTGRRDHTYRGGRVGCQYGGLEDVEHLLALEDELANQRMLTLRLLSSKEKVQGSFSRVDTGTLSNI